MNHLLQQCPVVTILIIAGVLISVSPADAHKVTVFAWVEGDRIHTQSKFSGGKLVSGGRIEVHNPMGDVLLTGTTDDQGAFSFTIPQKSDLKVVLKAGSGHGNYWIVPATEMNAVGHQPGQEGHTDAKTAPTSADFVRPNSIQPAPVQPDPALGNPEPREPCLNARDVEAMMARLMDAKLAPLKAQLADPAWGLRDILAGIGYILGLMGLAAYVHYQRQGK